MLNADISWHSFGRVKVGRRYSFREMAAVERTKNRLDGMVRKKLKEEEHVDELDKKGERKMREGDTLEKMGGGRR